MTIGHEPDLDACLALSQIQGAKSGMVSVRSAPDARAKEIDRLSNGDFVHDCDDAGEWAGVVYLHGEQTPDCGVTSPVPKAQAYAGPCRSGWVRRKWMIVAGMWVQAAGIGVFLLGPGSSMAVSGAVALGVGTAFVYPTLLATISDAAKPAWRASALGVYRMWRDAGYAASALLAGTLADSMGIPTAIAAVAALTFCSGVVVAVMMKETL